MALNVEKPLALQFIGLISIFLQTLVFKVTGAANFSQIIGKIMARFKKEKLH